MNWPTLEHPRLAVITVIGVGLVVAGLGLLVADVTSLLDPGAAPFQVAVIGAIVTLIGLTGFVSMWVFERRERKL